MYQKKYKSARALVYKDFSKFVGLDKKMDKGNKSSGAFRFEKRTKALSKTEGSGKSARAFRFHP